MSTARIPSDFATDDVSRVAEFFGGGLDETREFIRNVWLPDAMQTVHRIIRECDCGPRERVAFLCDHLREGSRTVGASKIVDAADLLYAAYERDANDCVRALAGTCVSSLNNYSLQLQGCV